MEEIENPADSNQILVKQTIDEDREEINMLQESKEEIEPEINQKFETEKDEIEVMEVKETVDNREEINMLQESKEEIEPEINHKFETEKKDLEGKLMEVKAEMKKEVDKVKAEVEEKVKEGDLLRMKIKELEKQNFDEIERLKLKYDGVSQEKSELGDEINKLKKSLDLLNVDLVREREVVSEMETIQEKLDLQVEESRDLKAKIKKLEKNEVLIQNRLSEVEMENEKLVKVKKTLESVKTEKKAVEKKLSESLKAFDELKQDKERIVLQKENIEKNRLYQLAKMDDLEKYVQELVATIASLEKSNKMLGSEVEDENKERDESFERLLGEKCLFEQKLVDLGKMFEELKREKGEIVAEKNKIEKQLVDLEKMVEELKREKDEIVAEMNKIEKNKADQSVKVALDNVKWRKRYTEALEKQQLLRDELHSERKKVKEIVEEKDFLEKTYKEQTEANLSGLLKELELKKKEELYLSLKVKKLQNIIIDAVKEIEKQKKGKDSLAVEMKKLETRSELLITEKSLVEQKLVEVEKGNQCLASKMNSAQLNAQKALLMLKDAAQVLYIDMMKIEEDIQPVASELESIRKAFKKKDKKMEEMTQQIKNLNRSARKNFSILALVSTATTILSAAAATYIARGQ
ncbi:hypothetical protein MKX03_037423 [Papaver bracteatum]|nr:hypothetical protein MKX03_037423 [Papaver bracteatum]